MSHTTYPEDEGDRRFSKPEIWQDPKDTLIKVRYFLGETSDGRLILRETKRGVDLLWDIKDDADLSFELYMLMQTARALVAIQAKRLPNANYEPIANSRMWNGCVRYFICTLPMGKYLIEPRIGTSGESLWNIEAK